MDIVFSTKWFEKYQQKLLWLLNNYITKRWFRWCMRIDCNTTINQITPNSYSFNGKILSDDKIKITTDFRTHDKYSKRLYFAFKPLWYVMHAMDWAMLDRVEALTKLSFGFSTLTQYPGSIGANNPVDGRVTYYNPGDSWATTIGAANGTSVDITANPDIFCEARNISGNFLCMRDVFCFDTSALTSGATISAATFSLAGDGNAESNPDSASLNIVSATPANTDNLVVGDYDNFGTTLFATALAFSSWDQTDGTYNDNTLNASGISNISKTGVSSFGTRISLDISGTQPTGNNNIEGYMSDESGTTKDPKLVVTYTVVTNNGSPFFGFI